MDKMRLITIDFTDVMLGVNGVNELNIIDGEGVFGGSYVRRLSGVDISPISYTSTGNVLGVVMVAEPVPGQRGFNLTYRSFKKSPYVIVDSGQFAFLGSLIIGGLAFAVTIIGVV